MINIDKIVQSVSWTWQFLEYTVTASSTMKELLHQEGVMEGQYFGGAVGGRQALFFDFCNINFFT